MPYLSRASSRVTWFQTLLPFMQIKWERMGRREIQIQREIALSHPNPLLQTVDEIAHTEATISQLRETHWEKQRPLKVAQTRLSNRHQRPNVEMCRDEPAHRQVKSRTSSLLTSLAFFLLILLNPIFLSIKHHFETREISLLRQIMT